MEVDNEFDYRSFKIEEIKVNEYQVLDDEMTKNKFKS
jgi:hypothetical protein